MLQFIHNNNHISVVFIFYNNYFGVIDQIIENSNLEEKTKIRFPVRGDSDTHGGKSWVEDREQQQKIQKVNKIKHSKSMLTFSFSFLPYAFHPQDSPTPYNSGLLCSIDPSWNAYSEL